LVVPPQRARPAEPKLEAQPQALPLANDDDDSMEIQRGGALISEEPARSVRTSRSPAGSAAPSLELAHPRRPAPAPHVERGPKAGERILAWCVPLVLCGATLAALVKLAHRPGRSVLLLAPHVFDASSVALSGGAAGALLVLAIAIGYAGFRLEPRSYALVGSAAALLLASLAMVTIALVATEEHAFPPDGARLMPYLLPLALTLGGIASVLRGPTKYLDDARLQAGAAGIIGGGLLFAALELSGRSLF
jgi:hypothetical protein